MGLREDLSEKVISTLSLDDETALSKLNGHRQGAGIDGPWEEKRGRGNNIVNIPEALAKKRPNSGKGA